MIALTQLYDLFIACKTITTDTRDCPKGSMFFALKGANFNGNAFAQKALDLGCAYAVIDEEEYKPANDERFLLVDDVLNTLQQLANYHRKKLNTPIVSITGTNGKTTTKELLATVLAKKYNVLYTLGNLNNDIGVPKTLLRLTNEHDMAVIEMGASHVGDIKILVDIVEPDYALITNVGRAHLQGFGSFEGVKRTKAELYDFMALHERANKVFVNTSLTDLNEMYANHCAGSSCLSYGISWESDAQYVGEVTQNNPFVSFKWKENKANEELVYTVNTKLIGAYNLANMMAAVRVGRELGVEPNLICEALEEYTPSNSRSQLMKTAHNTVIMDAYNANPTSMKAAVDNFQSMEATRKMVILGDIKELGEVSNKEHQDLSNLLATCSFDKVWLVGSEFMKTQNAFDKFENVNEVIKKIQQEPLKNYTILVKGSNGIKLQTLETLL